MIITNVTVGTYTVNFMSYYVRVFVQQSNIVNTLLRVVIISTLTERILHYYLQSYRLRPTFKNIPQDVYKVLRNFKETSWKNVMSELNEGRRFAILQLIKIYWNIFGVFIHIWDPKPLFTSVFTFLSSIY